MPDIPSIEALRTFRPAHATLVGIDSDGCVFDTMDSKQKLCFHGLIASHWGLEAVEPIVRETAEFVNLYSCWRGQNRFLALLKTFELLEERPEIRSAGIRLPEFPALRSLIDSGVTPSNPALDQEIERAGNEELKSLLAWSCAVNAEIAAKVPTGPLFPWARESLVKVHDGSDVLCVSQTPTDALLREWEKHDVRGFVFAIAGQELGSKAESLRAASEGRYGPGRVLMIGDAPGDLRAAQEVSALFYPINPAREAQSWERFHNEAYDRFLAGTFCGDYEDERIAEFTALLPESPTWQTL